MDVTASVFWKTYIYLQKKIPYTQWVYFAYQKKKKIVPLLPSVFISLLCSVWHTLTSQTPKHFWSSDILDHNHTLLYIFKQLAAGMHFTVWLVKVLGTLDSYSTEVWLCLLANPPPVRKPFPFGAHSWSTQRAATLSAVERCLCISVPPQECLGLLLRKHPALRQPRKQGMCSWQPAHPREMFVCRSGCICLLLWSVCDNSRAFSVMADSIYSTLSLSRPLSAAPACHPTRPLSTSSNILSSCALSHVFIFFSCVFSSR